MEFAEYLRGKKIDPEQFEKSETSHYKELKIIFDQVHPESFTQQKLFLINPIRRKYTLEEEVAEEVRKSSPKAMKPKILPKRPKIN